MKDGTDRKAKGPGRPAKFGRPGRVVAFTLPEDAIARLHRVHRDLGWAIVKLLDLQVPNGDAFQAPPDVELVAVSGRGSLIVVNHEAIRTLPGVNMIPFGAARAFLALEPGRSMSDLELVVGDRLSENGLERGERRALLDLQQQLRAWRHDGRLRFHTRSIILVEHLPGTAGDKTAGRKRRRGARRSPSGRAPAPAASGTLHQSAFISM